LHRGHYQTNFSNIIIIERLITSLNFVLSIIKLRIMRFNILYCIHYTVLYLLYINIHYCILNRNCGTSFFYSFVACLSYNKHDVIRCNKHNDDDDDDEYYEYSNITVEMLNHR